MLFKERKMRESINLKKWTFSIPERNYAREIEVPYTWNVDDPVMDYRGKTIYECKVEVNEALKGMKAFITFNAVYHNAVVFVNGVRIGEHSCSGYTPFRFEITDKLKYGAQNTILVEADSTHTKKMIPYKSAFDWADDGGIIRKVELSFVPSCGFEYVHVSEAIESIKGDFCSGKLNFKTAFLDRTAKNVRVEVLDYKTNEIVLTTAINGVKNKFTIPFENLKLWSHKKPNLYMVKLFTAGDEFTVRIGLRKIEVKNNDIYLNDAPVYLKGCEWMPGSHPDYGMAEPLEHSVKMLKQLKDAGCVFTRFHWQQDSSIYDWCDENGLLVQEEIPYWGNPQKVTRLQLKICKQQADEMVYFHYNHPSVIFWGVGNELGGERRATVRYVKKMLSHFKEQDDRRLVNYVSNSLSKFCNTRKPDATLYGDVAMWNDYLGLWEPTDNVENHMIKTCNKCKGKPLVISEFGLCEPTFKGGDEERCRILKERLERYSHIDNIKGYMWFSLNDYRTHVGEAGKDKTRQRIHGSTDLYGNPKPSYELLRKLQVEK